MISHLHGPQYHLSVVNIYIEPSNSLTRKSEDFRDISNAIVPGRPLLLAGDFNFIENNSDRFYIDPNRILRPPQEVLDQEDSDVFTVKPLSMCAPLKGVSLRGLERGYHHER